MRSTKEWQSQISVANSTVALKHISIEMRDNAECIESYCFTFAHLFGSDIYYCIQAEVPYMKISTWWAKVHIKHCYTSTAVSHTLSTSYKVYCFQRNSFLAWPSRKRTQVRFQQHFWTYAMMKCCLNSSVKYLGKSYFFIHTGGERWYAASLAQQRYPELYVEAIVYLKIIETSQTKKL